MKKIETITHYSNKYTFSTFLRMSYSFVMTKLFWRKARIVTYPIYIHGKKKIKYGKGLMLGHDCRIDAINDEKDTLIIGDNCDFGNFCHISAVSRIVIGNNFLCGDFVFIGDSCHGLYLPNGNIKESSPNEPPTKRSLIGSEVIIGNNVWLGDKVSVMPGVTIGNGCVVGANSVVTKNLPDNSVCVGNPAKPIRIWNDEKTTWESLRNSDK